MNSLEFLFFLVFAGSSILNIADSKEQPSLLEAPANSVIRVEYASVTTITGNATSTPHGKLAFFIIDVVSGANH